MALSTRNSSLKPDSATTGPQAHRCGARKACKGCDIRTDEVNGPHRGALKTCTAGGTTPSNTYKDMALDGWPVRSSIPRTGSFTSRWRKRADVRHLSRVQRLARRVLPHRSRPLQGHRDGHRVSTRAPALRPIRVRAVLGPRCGARPAT